MNTLEIILLVGVIPLFIAIIFLCQYLKGVLTSPFHYPYFDKTFDVTGKRNVSLDNLVDDWLCDQENRKSIETHEKRVDAWKEECRAYIEQHRFKKRRTRQLAEACWDDSTYRFYTTRLKTKYSQRNYVRTAYKDPVIEDNESFSYMELKQRIADLSDIGFECSRSEYFEKNQRKRMSPVLRRKIMLRDNFTCQICGKYMPDGVGLQIDHIVPVSKGGKTVPSNLQVLCSRCNAKKGAKILEEDREEKNGTY